MRLRRPEPVPEAESVPPRLIRYDPGDWPGAQSWWDARDDWQEAHPDAESLGMEGPAPDVLWDPELI